MRWTVSNYPTQNYTDLASNGAAHPSKSLAATFAQSNTRKCAILDLCTYLDILVYSVRSFVRIVYHKFKSCHQHYHLLPTNHLRSLLPAKTQEAGLEGGSANVLFVNELQCFVRPPRASASCTGNQKRHLLFAPIGGLLVMMPYYSR